MKRKSTKRIPWTPQEDDLIESWYGVVKASEVAARLFKATGIRRSKEAVVLRANRIHRLTASTGQTGVTIPEAAKELGVTHYVIRRMIGSGQVKTFGRGKCRFIDFDELERIRPLFPSAPARSMTKYQAMGKIGYSETHFTRLLQAGVVRGVKRGDRWFVDADHVDQLAAEMRRKGVIRLDLSGVPSLDEQRAKCREYCRSIRNVRRAEQNRQNGGAA